MTEENETDHEHDSRLQSCSLCDNGMSPYSLFCRNCGHPQGRPPVIALLVLFLLVLLAVYIGFMLFCSCDPEQFESREGTSHRIEQPAATARR
jgi:hypothetical protein